MVSPLIKRELQEIGFISLQYALIGWLLPVLALTFGRGLESQELLTKALFYGAVGVPFFLANVFMKIAHLFNPKGTLDAILHDTEDSPFFKATKIFGQNIASFRNMFFLGGIFFSIFGLLGAVQNTFLSGVIVQQQVAETATVILSMEPAVTVETMILLFVINILILGLNSLVSRGVLNRVSKTVFTFTIVPLVSMLFWVAFHTFRYGNSEVALLGVAVFGLVSTYLTVTFNSYIPMYLFHLYNNAYFTLNTFASDNAILIGTFIWIFLLVAGYASTVLARNSRLFRPKPLIQGSPS